MIDEALGMIYNFKLWREVGTVNEGRQWWFRD